MKYPFDSFIRLLRFSLEGEKFGAPGNQDYFKTRLGLDIYLKPKSALSKVSSKISGNYTAASDLRQFESQTPAKMKSYLSFGYLLQRTGFINPYNMFVSLELGDSYQKTSLELNFRYSYYGKKRGLDARLFAGTMLNTGSSDPLYSFTASGRSGPELYLYQGFYPDRFTSFPETVWSKQMTMTEGGLVTPVSDSLGYSRWLCSLTLTSSLPEKVTWIPVKPFASFVMDRPGGGTSSKAVLFFEAGFKAGIWDFFEIWVPLLVSDNINSINGSIKGRIRFVFRLDKLNPLLLK